MTPTWEGAPSLGPDLCPLSKGERGVDGYG
jgi:hypothetical protein